MKPRPYGTPKQAVASLFEEAGGAERVMEILELSRTRVYAFADPDADNEISFARVCAITEQTRATAAAEHLARLAGGAFLPVEAEGSDDWLSLAGEAARKNAQTVAALLEALSETDVSPGEVDADEARELLELVDQQMKLLAAKRAKLAETVSSARTGKGS